MRLPRLFVFLVVMSVVGVACNPKGGSSSSGGSSVTILRDGNFWPHVFGESDLAAAYGFGIAQMRDVPVTVARNFAMSSGELAKILGEGLASEDGAGLNVLHDLRTRLWRIDQIAARQIETMPQELKQRLRAYAEGLNEGRREWLANAAQLANNTEPVAYDLVTLNRLLGREITFEDVVRHGVQVNGLTAVAVMDQLAYSDDPTASEDHIRTASNSFAIGALASASGRPMLVADPHLGFQDIGQLRSYFAQVDDGRNTVSGISFPGFPCLAMGFNNDFAWALTSNNPDVSDVWRAPTDPEGSTYLFDGGPRAIIREEVTIEVWDDETGALVDQSHQLAYAGSYDRPILREAGSDSPTGPMIWYGGSTFATERSLWEFFIRLGAAHSVAEARAAFDLDVIMAHNVLMTDRNGGLGYVWTGRVPRRGAPTPGTNWAQVQDGTSSAYQWTEVHPASELPYEERRAGEIDSIDGEKWTQCNAPADQVVPNTSLRLDDFPEYMVHAATTPIGWRQLRARELLSSSEPISAAELRAIAIDDIDLWWRAMQPFALAVMDEFSLWDDVSVATTMARMSTWDLSTAPDLAEPLVSHLVRAYYGKTMYELEADGAEAPSYVDFSFPDDLPDFETFLSPAWLPNRQALADALLAADDTWRRSINRVLPELNFSESPWTPTPFLGLSREESVWGTAHYLNLTPNSSPQSTAAYPVAGSVSLFSLTNAIIKKPWESITEEATVLGRTGPVIQLPLDAGAHTLLQVEFTASGVEAWFLEAIGPSEIADDANRYRHTADFVAGTWTRFPTDTTTISASGSSVDKRVYGSVTR